jgi:hypothetical protein
MRKLLVILPMSGALLLSPSLFAQDRDHGDHDNRHHVYDKRNKDYHDFDEHEDRAWRIYWQQHHHNYIDWDRASARQRQDYWNWRHSHSDSVLQINIR